tara:strand:- start:2582 stop:3001 length:420 start_codon:yes stop_codon:yes gene_type:complete
MGLDQYAVARKGQPRKVPQTWTTTDADGNEEEVVEYYDEWEDSMELASWRKHPNLQGWMENLWYEKGGEGQFNCVELELTLEDLDALEATLDEEALPETAGFFFGGNADDHYAEADREFIVQARAAIKQGYKVVYSSWW